MTKSIISLVLFLLLSILISNVSRAQDSLFVADSTNRKQLADYSKSHLYTCYMEMYRGRSKKTRMGTGFLIHPRVILTAAHNIAFYPTGRVKRVDAFFGSINDSTFKAKAEVNLKRGKNKFFNASYFVGGIFGRDYGIIILPDSSLYKQLGGCYRIDELTPEILNSRTDSLSLTGSPMDKPPHEVWTETKGDFRMVKKGISSCLYTKERNSGSPIWYEYNSQLYVAAIHSRGNPVTHCGRGRLIDTKVIKKMRRWCTKAGVDL